MHNGDLPWALRDGKAKSMDAVDIVPGDVLIVRLGDIVPTDVKILGDGSSKEEQVPLQVRSACLAAAATRGVSGRGLLRHTNTLAPSMQYSEPESVMVSPNAAEVAAAA